MNRVLCGALAVAAVGLSFSCSKEEIKNSGYDPGVAEYDQTRYLKVVLANPGAGTKAPDFQNGSDSENEIKDIRFVFYDKDGNLTSNTVIVSGDQITPELETPENGSVNSVVKLSLPVDITQGENMPAYVMCYVNSFRPGDVGYKTINELLKAKRDKVVGTAADESAETFPMNNSSYFGYDIIQGKEMKILATPIPPDAFSATERDASPITIHVERYAAKVQLKMPEQAKIHDFEIDGKKLKFTPSGWAVSAVDKEMYLVKHFGLAEDQSESLESIYNRLGTWWNDAPNFRSYWSCSPGYYTRDYPEVSDDILDTPETARTAYSVEYLSYSTVTSAANSMDKNVRYTREGTVPKELFHPTDDGKSAVKNPKATLPSVIIAGKYQIDGQDADQDFFIYGGKVYVTKQIMLAYMVNNAQRIVYSSESGTEYNKEVSNFTLEHPKQVVRGDIKVPGRYVTLQLRNASNGMYFWKDGSYQAVTSDNLNEVNRLLMTSAGYAESYIEGMAYFAVPIKHIRWYENDNPQKTIGIASEDWDWTKVRTGDFGIVRNHVYDIVISEIKGRATGLYSKDQPLVPPTDIASYDVTYEVKTLNWAVVPTQTETL